MLAMPRRASSAACAGSLRFVSTRMAVSFNVSRVSLTDKPGKRSDTIDELGAAKLLGHLFDGARDVDGWRHSPCTLDHGTEGLRRTAEQAEGAVWRGCRCRCRRDTPSG